MDTITQIITDSLFANPGFTLSMTVEFTPDFRPMTDDEIDREIDAMLGPIN